MAEAAASAAEDPGSDAEPGGQRTTVAILADDLIWATRLSDAVSAAGTTPRRVRRLEDLDAAVAEGADHVLVDLTARAYDGVTAVQRAAAAGAKVLAVGQHDDVPLRRRAIAAGAQRVYTYRALFEDGPRAIRTWLGR